MTEISKPLRDSIVAALALGPRLRLAVLFGSQARGTGSRSSDFDIGVIPVDETLSLHDELLLASAISGVTGTEVDIVRLDGAAPLLGAEVARDGVCLLEETAGAFASFRARAISEWVDFEEVIGPAPCSLSPAPLRRRAMTNVALVAKKLAVLDEYLQRLRDRRPTTLEAFVQDTLVQDAIAMGVLVVVQEALDIALHIASDEGWELASTYREAFLVLERHGVLSSETATALGGAAQLRNRIAHGYATMDAPRLWAELPSGIAAFSAFASAVSAYLTKPIA